MSKKRKVKTTKKAAARASKANQPLTFIVIQGVSPKLKAGGFRKAKAKEMTFSAWAREALGAAR